MKPKIFGSAQETEDSSSINRDTWQVESASNQETENKEIFPGETHEMGGQSLYSRYLHEAATHGMV